MRIEMFDKAEKQKEIILNKKSNSNTDNKAVKIPVFESQFLENRKEDKSNYYVNDKDYSFLKPDSEHRPLANSAACSLLIGFAFEIIHIENEERKLANKKIKKADEKYKLIDFDCNNISIIASDKELCDFSSKEFTPVRIRQHIKASVKRHKKLKFTVSEDFPFIIKGFTAQDSCLILSAT